MKRKPYSGFCYPGEIYADNRKAWEEILADESASAIDKQEARSHLAFLKLFPPGEPHLRIAGHLVEVEQIKNPTWVRQGRLWTPQGKLEKILSLNVCEAVRRACEEIHNNPPKIVETDVVIDLPDGSEVRGTRVRTGNFIGPSYAKRFPCDFLTLEFNCSRFAPNGSFSYSFGIPVKAVETPKEPKKYTVVSFVTVDGREIQRERKELWPQFVGVGQEWSEKFAHFCYKTHAENNLFKLAGLPAI